ncbi:MAG: radical SAM protein [Candidatus Edwardsbacteria bacterium]
MSLESFAKILERQKILYLLLSSYRKGKTRRIQMKALKGEELPVPKNLVFEVTQRCNLNCIMCWYRFCNTENEFPELSLEQIAFLFQKILKPYKIRTCYLTGSEPFIRDDLEEIIKIITKENILVSIQTNGTLLTENRLQKLEKYKRRIASIDFSFDGFEDTHDLIRGEKGVFAKAYHNFKLCGRFDIKSAVSFVILNENLNEMENILDIFNFPHLRFIDFSLVVNSSEEEISESLRIMGLDKKILNITAKEKLNYSFPLEMLEEYLKRTIQKGNVLGTNVFYTPQSLYPYLRHIYMGDIRKYVSLTCGVFGNFRITPDGFVIHCPFIRKRFGDLFKESVKEIWNKKDFRKLRQVLLEQNLLPICKRCCKLQLRTS